MIVCSCFSAALPLLHGKHGRSEFMNGRTLIRCIAIAAVTLATGACTTAPPEKMSILDVMATGASSGTMSCAALDAATLCVKGARLDRSKKCGCVDKGAITDGQAFSF